MADTDCKGSSPKESGEVRALPPWGDQPPARPLSPQRRRKTTFTSESHAIAVLQKKTDFPRPLLSSVLVCVLTLTGALCWFHSGRSVAHEHASKSESSALNGTMVIQEATEPKTTTFDSKANKSFTTTGSNSAVVEWLTGESSLEMFAKSCAFTIDKPRVHLETLKLEEMGTAWSQPQLPSATGPSSSDVNFRSDEDSTSEQERPGTYKRHWASNGAAPTYKLEWFGGKTYLENGSTYKLEWFGGKRHSEDVPTYKLEWFGGKQNAVPPPKPFELRWQPPAVSAPTAARPYELRWFK